MSFVGLIMAGGKGKRMDSKVEKPLIKLNGKPMLEHIIEPLKELDEIEKIVVAFSPYTPETAKFAKSLSVITLKTPGEGFHADMKEAIKEIGEKPVLVISADLPLINRSILKEIIARFEKSSKPSLCVFVNFDDFNFSQEDKTTSRVDGKSVSPAGINIIEGGKINEPKIEQENMTLSRPELALNINDKKTLALARKFLSEDEL
ncbi:hypothetical protein AKJ49_01265 [candidate division MSBL1 archaeon SCGC-AAA382A03]|uniref:MobA-like NTP transferase domain-containing protein n=1 Tax=candidate division MSBL1 archaeon SCGC-AAA382A03 TaxID=1698278 RepID=A0A133VFL4_9EURY|nr:hypothetical protein AKJ49_01265 [candidate division MSBL1 archaeon SCGC-AAA382A03]